MILIPTIHMSLKLGILGTTSSGAFSKAESNEEKRETNTCVHVPCLPAGAQKYRMNTQGTDFDSACRHMTGIHIDAAGYSKP